jgi:multidrug efflux pump subunit AcrA (membrane-fusion protein)
MFMNKRLLALRLLPVLILVLSVGAYAYMKTSKPERVKPVAKEKVWTVDVLMAEKQTLSPGLTLYGRVETQEMVSAAAPGAGLIVQVQVKPGDHVRTGQKLVSMDPRDFAVANLQARADVADIQAQLDEHDLRYRANLKTVEEEKRLLELAKNEVKRVERLKSRNLSSESALSDAHEVLGRQELALISRQLEVDRYETSRQQLRARLSRARANLAQTELAIERSEVTAAFDGVVADVMVSVGDRVRESDVLVSLYSLESLEIRARIPASYQAEIQYALGNGDELSATANLSVQKKPLLLSRLAGEADPSGIDGYFRVAEDTNGLRVGNLVRIELLRPRQQDVMAVPFRSIYGNNRVFVVREGRMRAINVESVGQYENVAGENSVLIRSDRIDSGDAIIVTHLPNAVDGLKVTVTGDKAAEIKKMSAKPHAAQE